MSSDGAKSNLVNECVLFAVRKYEAVVKIGLEEHRK